MRHGLRWMIPLAFLAGVALLLALNGRWRWVGRVITGLAFAFILVGSIVRLWRVGHGDFRFTTDAFWLPKRWQAWMLGQDLPEKSPAQPRRGGRNSN